MLCSLFLKKGKSLGELCGIPIDVELFHCIFHGSSSHTDTGIVFSSSEVRSTCVYWHGMAWLLVSTPFRACQTKQENVTSFYVSSIYPTVMMWSLFLSLPIFPSPLYFSSQLIFLFLLPLFLEVFVYCPLVNAEGILFVKMQRGFITIWEFVKHF